MATRGPNRFEREVVPEGVATVLRRRQECGPVVAVGTDVLLDTGHGVVPGAVVDDVEDEPRQVRPLATQAVDGRTSERRRPVVHDDGRNGSLVHRRWRG